MEKSADAFRTISEVADDLDLPAHVLRFWETRFPQIRPLKRAGGRRYYRPADVGLLRTIRVLLYDEGYTIKGVQRLLKEQGPRGIDAALKGGAPDNDTVILSVPSMPVDLDLNEGAEPDDVAWEPQNAASVPDPPRRRGEWHALQQALATIEECQRILSAVRR